MKSKPIIIGIILILLLSSLILIASSYESNQKNTIYVEDSGAVIINNGSLSGFVNNYFSNPIEGAVVRITCGGYLLENISNSSGYYYIGNVPIVDCYWNVSASKSGYRTASLDMSIDENTTYDFILMSLGKTLYVGGYGPGNFSKIQDAINHASDGDTVFVYNGVYYENVIMNKSIALVGEDINSTIIDGINKSSVINVGAEWVLIEKFTIRNGNSGVKGWLNNVTISQNIIVNNDKGIELSYSENNNITGNVITDNNYGIAFYEVKDSVIKYNHIMLNKKIGILFTMATMPGLCSENNTVYYNIIQKNTMGIFLEYSPLNKINCNNFYQNIVDASFKASSWTNWNHNYWGRPRIFPKTIFGFGLFRFHFWFNLDWRPAKEPYDIPL